MLCETSRFQWAGYSPPPTDTMADAEEEPAARTPSAGPDLRAARTVRCYTPFPPPTLETGLATAVTVFPPRHVGLVACFGGCLFEPQLPEGREARSTELQRGGPLGPSPAEASRAQILRPMLCHPGKEKNGRSVYPAAVKDTDPRGQQAGWEIIRVTTPSPYVHTPKPLCPLLPPRGGLNQAGLWIS